MSFEKGFKCPGELKGMFASMNMTPLQKRTFLEAEQLRLDRHRDMLKRKWVDVLSEENRPRRPSGPGGKRHTTPESSTDASE